MFLQKVVVFGFQAFSSAFQENIFSILKNSTQKSFESILQIYKNLNVQNRSQNSKRHHNRDFIGKSPVDPWPPGQQVKILKKVELI